MLREYGATVNEWTAEQFNLFWMIECERTRRMERRKPDEQEQQDTVSGNQIIRHVHTSMSGIGGEVVKIGPARSNT